MAELGFVGDGPNSYQARSAAGACDVGVPQKGGWEVHGAVGRRLGRAAWETEPTAAR